jgi:ATP-binding cassette subfamily B protein
VTVKSVLHLGRTMRLVWGVARGWTLANIVLAVVQGLLPLLGLWLIQLIVDSVTRGIESGDTSAAFRETGLLILAAAGVGVLSAFARSLGTLATEALSLVVTDHVMDIIHTKSVAADLEYYENSRYYDVLHRAQQEAPYRPSRIVADLVQLGQSVVTLVAVLGLIMSLHWSLGLIIIAAAVPGAIVRTRYSNSLFRWQWDRTMTERMAWYFHVLLTDGARAKELRLFNLGPTLGERYRDLRRVLRRERLKLARRRATGELASAVLATLAIFGTFAYIAKQTIEGVLTVGQMVMLYQAFQTGLTAFQGVLNALAGLYEDNLFLTNYYEFMALSPKVTDAENPVPVARPLRGGIVFEDVTFSYPDTERTAVADISLELRPGEVVALVGHNGSGKTTLAKLLCRLYDPLEGRITLDGTDLRSLSIADLRRAISVVFQDFTQYQLSARENIRVGNVDLSDDDPAVEAAARDAGVHDVIGGLSHGYETTLGKMFEDGEELSTGEWQKIAVARAFVRDAEVMVFDEPTSALDPLAEWKVFEQIRQRAAGRAVVLISHRFSTVRNADRIYILEGGRIIEQGTHAELIALDGRYARMYEVQARAYGT